VLGVDTVFANLSTRLPLGCGDHLRKPVPGELLASFDSLVHCGTPHPIKLLPRHGSPLIKLNSFNSRAFSSFNDWNSFVLAFMRSLVHATHLFALA